MLPTWKRFARFCWGIGGDDLITYKPEANSSVCVCSADDVDDN